MFTSSYVLMLSILLALKSESHPYNFAAPLVHNVTCSERHDSRGGAPF